MSEFQPGDRVLLSIRRHLYVTRNKQQVENPPMEGEGVFVRYHDDKQRAWVKIKTIEGEKERSFAIERISAGKP